MKYAISNGGVYFLFLYLQIYKLYIELKSLWRIYYLFELNLSYNLYYVK